MTRPENAQLTRFSILKVLQRQHWYRLIGGTVLVSASVVLVVLGLLLDVDWQGHIRITWVKIPISIAAGIVVTFVFLTGTVLVIVSVRLLRNLTSAVPLSQLSRYGDPLEIVKAIEEEMIEPEHAIRFGRELRSFQLRGESEGLSGPAYVTRHWLVCIEPLRILRLDDIVFIEHVMIDEPQYQPVRQVLIRDRYGNEVQWEGKHADCEGLVRELRRRAMPKAR